MGIIKSETNHQRCWFSVKIPLEGLLSWQVVGVWEADKQSDRDLDQPADNQTEKKGRETKLDSAAKLEDCGITHLLQPVSFRVNQPEG